MSAVAQFINERIAPKAGASVPTRDVVAAYAVFNHGSLAGKRKLYADIRAIDGASCRNAKFFGITLLDETHPTEEPIEEPEAGPTFIQASSLEISARTAKSKQLAQLHAQKEAAYKARLHLSWEVRTSKGRQQQDNKEQLKLAEARFKELMLAHAACRDEYMIMIGEHHPEEPVGVPEQQPEIREVVGDQEAGYDTDEDWQEHPTVEFDDDYY